MGLHRNYKRKIRTRPYIVRLIERNLCLDANHMASNGFFRGGRYTEWEYLCKTEAEGFIGKLLRCTLVDSEYRDEHKVLLKSEELPERGVEIRVVYLWNDLVKWRPMFLCPRCRKRVATLFLHAWPTQVACRRCHKLIYWCQYRGHRRIGHEAYERGKVLYKVHKILRVVNNEAER